MTAIIIITFCLLLLLGYLFEVTSPKTKIPSVLKTAKFSLDF